MKLTRLLGLTVLLCCLPLASLAQDRPAWVTAIPSAVKKDEPSWTFKELDYRSPEGWHVYSFRVAEGKRYAVVEMQQFDVITNPAETLDGFATIRDNLSNGTTDRLKIEGFADQAYAWRRKATGEWSEMLFRKERMFVEINCTSEDMARRAAQVIMKVLAN